MADFDFHVPSRYDETLADEGIWVTVTDHKDQHWGDFKVVLFDSESPKLIKARDNSNRKYAKEIRTKDANADKLVAVETFINAILVDWKNVKDSKGKEIPHSKEAARAYFNNPAIYKFVFNYLFIAAQDLNNFDTPSKDEVLGN